MTISRRRSILCLTSLQLLTLLSRCRVVEGIFIIIRFQILNFLIFYSCQKLLTQLRIIQPKDIYNKLEIMEMRKISRLSYLGACFGSGQPIGGVQHGPKGVRESGLFKTLLQNYKVQVNDHGDVTQIKNDLKYNSHINNLNILDPSLEQLNNRVFQTISKINDKEQLFLTVGGDHSIATGTIHGLLGKYPDLKVIWVDAHPDLINVDESKYPGYHGMPLSHLIGVNDKSIPGFKWLTRRLNPANIVHIGARDIDTDQWQTIKKYNIKFYTPDHIDMLGIGQVMKQTLAYLNPQSPIHISFDIDAMEPYLAESTGTKYRGGLTYRQGCHIIRRACHQANVVSMDLVEINPEIRVEGEEKRRLYRGEEHYVEGVNNTVAMGGALVESLFKKYLTL